MPTYEYRCTKCRSEFEHFQKMSDPHLKKCPECGGKVERKISSGAGIVFKGSGFYETDYKRKKPEPKSKESGDSAKPESAGKSEKSGGAGKSGGKGKSDKSGKSGKAAKKSKSSGGGND
jgi:putative FmdB family regulatory protein